MKDYISVALAKGRLAEKTIQILKRAGYDKDDCIDLSSRKLIFTDEGEKVKFILVKPSDVARYVEHGAADIGILGKDILEEQEPDVYEVVDLGFGTCRMVMAGTEEGFQKGKNKLIIATKYPCSAAKYCEEQGIRYQIVELSGSVELAPVVGLSHVIVDIVETGSTLKENGLKILAELYPISARLIVNRASFKLEQKRVGKMIQVLQENLRKKEGAI